MKSCNQKGKGTLGIEKHKKIDKIEDVPKTLTVSLSQIFPHYGNSTAS